MDGELTPSLAMVGVQVALAGLNILSKLALDSGMSAYVLIAYRQVVAGIFLSPIAYFIQRKTRMKITKAVMFQIFLCSLFGMETVGIRTLSGQAKIIGTAIGIGGSMLMTFYRGSLVHIWPSHIHWKYAEDMTASESAHHGATAHTASSNDMLLGAMLIIASCFAYAVWFIIQARMSKTFSSPYTSSAIMSWMAAIQCFAFGFAMEPKISGWALGWDIRLFTVLYIGLMGSGFAVLLMAWSLEKRGPLFVSMFSPLLLVIVAVLGWAVLDEKLYLGTVIGSVLIVGGLYLVLWGKGREMKKITSGSGGIKTIGETDDKDIDANISLPVYFSPKQETLNAQK